MKYSKIGWMSACAAAMAVMALMVISAPVSVQAQASDLRAIIPFGFHVGDTVLPAGTYTVSRTGAAGAIQISDQNGHTVSTFTDAVMRKSGLRASESLLVFNVYGDRYFLAEVRWAGYETARGLPKSRLEVQIAKTIPAKDVVQKSVATQ